MLDIEQANQDIRTGKSIALFCHCSVTYSGRAESRLNEGDRLILIKSDRTLLVHQPTGSTPVNYMKEGSVHAFSFDEKDKIKVTSGNITSKEHLTLLISKVYSYHAHTLQDNEKIQIAGTEKDMSDMIYAQPSLIHAGFKPVSREERVTYGFIDVFGYDKDNNLVIIECKRYTGDLKAVDQLERYVRKMKQLKGVDNIKGILACPKISSTAKHMLESYGFSWCRLEPPKYLQKHKASQQTLKIF